MDSASFVADHWWFIAVAEEQSNDNLDHMVADNGLETLPSGDMVSFELILRGMDSIIAKEFVDVEEVEEGPCNGVHDCW